jgi:hypothetical protein
MHQYVYKKFKKSAHYSRHYNYFNRIYFNIYKIDTYDKRVNDGDCRQYQTGLDTVKEYYYKEWHGTSDTFRFESAEQNITNRHTLGRHVVDALFASMILAEKPSNRSTFFFSLNAI